MGKSKSHPCKHPVTAVRQVDNGDLGTHFKCVKCGAKLDKNDTLDMSVVLDD